MRDVFEKYILDLKNAYADGGTEHSGRPALKTLLDAFAVKQNQPASVQHEPKRLADKGAPDFKVSRQGMILGYVKRGSTNLDKARNSDQIKRYRTLSANILLTDYLHFVSITRMASSARRCAMRVTSKIRNFGCAMIAWPPSRAGRLLLHRARRHRSRRAARAGPCHAEQAAARLSR